MIFKRPRLRPTCAIVNAGLAVSMIFLAACSPDAPENPADTADVADQAPQVTIEETLVLPAVWSTSALTAPITDIAFAGGAQPILAVSLSGGDLQLFDLQGDRLTSPESLDVKALGSGRTIAVEDTILTFFPGISIAGDLNIYTYNSVLGAPLAIPLLPDTAAMGLCAGSSLNPDAILTLAYWTRDDPTVLHYGSVLRTDGELEWLASPMTLEIATPITSCLIEAGTPVIGAEDMLDLAALQQNDTHITLSRHASGTLMAQNGGGDPQPTTIQNGITVRAPEAPSAMAAMSDVQFGGYPNGVIVVGGPVDGAHTVVFIEPGPLFEPPA